jgi:hypothetical protein
MASTTPTNPTNGGTATRSPERRTHQASTVRELYDQGNEAKEQIAELADAVRSLLQGGDALLRERMRTQPYATLATAAGIGYVLGGGLSPSMVRLLMAAGGRMALQGFAQRLVSADAVSGNTVDR